MKVLNLYFSTTGNTAKIAGKIEQTVQSSGHPVETLEVTKDMDLDILAYDFIFLGSGVYEWLPGKPLTDLLTKLRQTYAKNGDISPASPRRPGKKAVIYCSYGGAHTGIK